MGEALTEFDVDEISSGFRNLEYAEKEYEKDIKDLKAFQDRVEDLNLSNGLGQVKSGSNVIQDNPGVDEGATGSDLLKIYGEMLIDEDDILDEIGVIEKAFGFSTPAAHMYFYATNDRGRSEDDVKNFAAYLDQDAKVSRKHVNQVISFTESMKKVRENMFDVIDDEKSRLNYFQPRVKKNKNRIIELNQKNPLPLDFDDYICAANEIDESYQVLENLKQLRRLEIQSLNRTQGEFYRENINRIYGNESGDPVVDEIEMIQEIVNEASIEGVNYPLAR